jgi:hypothetical protein
VDVGLRFAVVCHSDGRQYHSAHCHVGEILKLPIRLERDGELSLDSGPHRNFFPASEFFFSFPT